jgi:hypothetical protein
MMRTVATVFAISLFGFSALALGQPADHNRYKWRDGQGNLHYDDALPNEAVQYGYDVVNPNGLVVKHVDRARTAEEMKADKEAAAKAAAAQRVVEEQNKNDQQILAAYPTEHDLTLAQQSQIEMIDQSVHATEVSLQNQEKSLSELLAHAADLDRTGKPVPAPLQQQIDSLRITVEKQKQYITSKGAEKQADAVRFETELAHYREILQKRQNR